jgi:hypothetical protein
MSREMFVLLMQYIDDVILISSDYEFDPRNCGELKNLRDKIFSVQDRNDLNRIDNTGGRYGA